MSDWDIIEAALNRGSRSREVVGALFRLRTQLSVAQKALRKLRGLTAQMDLVFGQPMMDGSHVPKTRALIEEAHALTISADAALTQQEKP